MYYPEEIIEEVRSRNDIVDVISSHIHIQKKGNNYVGLCPFHNDHSPSFSVSGNKQMYKCFACGESGNVISFVMKYENLTFQEAIQALAERGGVSLPVRQQTEEEKRQASARSRLMDLNKDAATFFYHMLRTPHGAKGMEYLKRRELTEETMQKFGLGYAGINGQEVINYLRSKGYSDDQIRKSGLASYSEKSGLYCQFWNRVMYPIFDKGGKVIGFGGRVLGDGEPKYLNSPETEVFNKRRNLYGLHIARSSRTDNFILCEGYMDVISMHQAGFTQTMASLGTAFTEEQAYMLKNYKRKILLAYDSDGAGQKAAIKAIKILRAIGMSGRVIHMDPYKDPDEFIKNLGKDAYQERIDQAENGFLFECRVLASKYPADDPDARTEFHHQLADILLEFQEKDQRENYLQAVCEKYLIPPDNMRDLVASHAAKGKGVASLPKPKQATGSRKVTADESAKRAQGMLLTWLTDDPSLYHKIKQYITPEDFTEGLYRRVAERLFSDFEAGECIPAAIISLFNDEEEQKEVASIFQTKLPHLENREEEEKAFHDILVSVKKHSYDSFSCQNGGAMDMLAMQRAITLKKELQQLAATKIKI